VNIEKGLPIFGGPADRPRSSSPGCTERIEKIHDRGESAYQPSVDTHIVVADVHREYERSSDGDGDRESSEASEASDVIHCASVRSATNKRTEASTDSRDRASSKSGCEDRART
jgi:hypothetical protein